MREIYETELNLEDGRTVDVRVHYCYAPHRPATQDEPADGGAVEIDRIEMETVIAKCPAGCDRTWEILPYALWPAFFDLEKLEESILNELSDRVNDEH